MKYESRIREGGSSKVNLCSQFMTHSTVAERNM